MPQFSDPHLAALGVLCAASAASIWAARRHPGRWVSTWARVLAVLIFAAWWGEYLADVLAGTWTSEYDLPLQLTDAISAVAVLALWTRRPALVELLYFWSLTATLQAVITPDLAQNFPSVYYFTYFTYHLGAIVGACLLVFGCGLYPRPGAALRVFWITLAWAAVAGTADLLTGGNYMYLRAKPEHGSLLSVMGPWPWYILATIALALALLMTLELLTPVRRSDPAARTRAVLRPGEPLRSSSPRRPRRRA